MKAFDKLTKKVTHEADQFAEGDVIRWKVRGELRPIGIDYIYTAVKAAGKWWISGTSSWYRHDGVTYEELVKYLQRKEIHGIQAATDWTDGVKSLPEPVVEAELAARARMGAEANRFHCDHCGYSEMSCICG